MDEDESRFTGKDWDEDVGLYYYNARWYDPTVGRFISEDSVADDPNLYGYCGGNPVNFTDPTGHAAEGAFKVSFQKDWGLVGASLNAAAMLTGNENLSTLSSVISLFVAIYDKYFKPKQTEDTTTAAKNNSPIKEHALIKQNAKTDKSQSDELKLKLGIRDKGFFGNLFEWIGQHIFGPTKFVEVTIITEDGKTIQFVANATDNKNVTRVLNAYTNAKNLGLKVMLTSVNGNSRLISAADNFGIDIGEYVGKKVTTTVFEKLWGKSVETMYETVFSKDMSFIGKRSGKLAGKAIKVFEIANKINEVSEFFKKYEYDVVKEDFFYVSLGLTSHPDSKLMCVFNNWLELHNEGKTYKGLVEAGRASSFSTAGVAQLYADTKDEMAEFGIDYTLLFL